MERRIYPRYFVGLEIQVQEEDRGFPLRGVTTDVSLGGCYVATIFPLAVGAKIHFTLRVAGGNVQGHGSVHTSHSGVGMGIRFAELTGKDRLLLDEYLRALVPTSFEEALQHYLR